MAQRSKFPCLSSSGYCCFCICKYTGASAAGPISKRTYLSTGCCLSCCLGQVMAQRGNGKYFADCAVSVMQKSLCPRLFNIGRNCSNVVCASVSNTCRGLISFCLLYRNYSYFVSLMTNVFTGTACYKMIYVVAIIISRPMALTCIICKQMSISRSYNSMTDFTDSISCAGRITYLMRPGTITVIVTYRTYLTVAGVIMSCSTINCIICHISGSSRQRLNGSTGCGIRPALKAIVFCHYRSLFELAVLERRYRDVAILHSRGLCGVTVYPSYREGLYLGTCTHTVIIGMAFVN